MYNIKPTSDHCFVQVKMTENENNWTRFIYFLLTLILLQLQRPNTLSDDERAKVNDLAVSWDLPRVTVENRLWLAQSLLHHAVSLTFLKHLFILNHFCNYLWKTATIKYFRSLAGERNRCSIWKKDWRILEFCAWSRNDLLSLKSYSHDHLPWQLMHR